MRAEWGLLLVVGCVGDTTATTDGGIDAAPDVAYDGTIEAATDSGVKVCDVHAPFTSSKLLKNLSAPALISEASLTADELTLFLSTQLAPDGGTGPTYYIYSAQRSNTTSDFSVPALVNELNTSGDNVGPWLMPDGKTIYFNSDRSNGFQIYVATRPTTTATFSAPAAVANINQSGSDNGSPSVAADGSEIFFISNRNSRHNGMFHAKVSGNAFGTPTELTELTAIDGGASGLNDPVISADGLTLYFCLMADANGAWPRQVWMAQRATPADPFGNVQPVAQVNADGPSYSSPAWLSPDNCRLYVTQQRGDAAAAYGVYVYSR